MQRLTGTYYLTQECPILAITSVANYLGKTYIDSENLHKISECEYFMDLDTIYLVKQPSKFSFVVQVFEDI